MGPWMIWFGKLLALLAGFMRDNPLPRHYRLAQRGPITYVVPVQVPALQQPVQLPPPNPPARTSEPRETVIDTIRQAEGYGASSRAVTYQWLARSTEPGVLILTCDGKQIGGWNKALRKYLAYDATS